MQEWTDWPVEIHNDPEQIKRIDDSFLTVLTNVNAAEETAKAENGYTTTLTKCTCGDFIKRHKPCKHMYRLAYELDRMILSKAAERSTELIANFKSGFAYDWVFAVGTCFWPALDIRYTQRKFNGRNALIPTQGYNYTFEHGMTFYDSPDAYKIWCEALKSFNVCIDVCSSYPNKKSYKFKYKDGVLYGDATYKYGPVSFDVFTVNKDKTGIEKIGHASLHADEFVELLATGSALTPDNEEFDIYEFVNKGGNIKNFKNEEEAFLKDKYGE